MQGVHGSGVILVSTSMGFERVWSSEAPCQGGRGRPWGQQRAESLVHTAGRDMQRIWPRIDSNPC